MCIYIKNMNIIITLFLLCRYQLARPEQVTTDSYASTELDKIEYFINTKPFACFLVALSPYPDLNIRRKCLGILRKTSLIAEALSVQNDPELGMFEVNATKFLTVISNNNLEQIDWITAALCLYLIVESEIQIEIEVAAQIASNMLASSLKDEECIDILVHNTYKRFEKILHTIDSPVTLISSNFMIAAWYPFQNGFNGIAHYRSVNTTGNGYLKTFSSNQTLKQESLRLAFYVPYEFLEDLVQNSLSKAKNDLFIIIYVQYVDNHPQLLVEINMKIPEYCKRNELPVLSVRYENDSWEYELGKENFDSTNGRSKCVLSSSFRFVKLRWTGFFESCAEYYCTPSTMGEIYFRKTPASREAYAKDFCVNGNAEIPYVWCIASSWQIPPEVNLECKNNFTTSVNTHKIYKMATECYNFETTGFQNDDVLRIINSPSLEYIDMKMLFDVLGCLTLNCFSKFHENGYVCNKGYYNMIFGCLNRILEYSKKLPKVYLNSTSTHTSLAMALSVLQLNPDTFRADDNYIYQRFLPSSSPLIGLILYKRDSTSFKEYQVKYLTSNNVSSSYASDQSVEVIIYYITSEKNIAANCSLSVFIVRHSLSPENVTVTARSRGIVIERCFPLEFRIFLRVIDREESWTLNHYTGEGYWLTIPPSRDENLFTVYISETNTYDYCGSPRNIEMWAYWVGRNTYEAKEKVIARKIDLLSMISMAVNNAESKSGTEEIFNKYSSTFKLFRMFGSIASMLGVMIIFATALVLRNWHKTRFYSIQLTIILTFQAIVFIIESKIEEFPQVGFFIFYYCTLSQFCWMSLIGYVQYTRYVKVFETKRLGTVKSLIIGWLFPAAVIAISLIFYRDCLKCYLCYKNKEIFLFFVLVPIGLVIIINIIVYIFAMISIWSIHGEGSLATERKLKVRASAFLPFLLGITWIFVLLIISPWSWLFVVGLFFIHIILPSQAVVLCIFVVLLDKPTRQQWKAQLKVLLMRRKQADI